MAVADPYRWLEDGDAPEVAAWVAAQNRRTRTALDALPHRGRWHERLVALVGLPTAIACQVRGERLFVLERAEGADQFALVLRSASDPTAAARVLLDPAAGVADAAMAIDWFEADPSGTKVALGLSEGGTEDSVLHVLHVEPAGEDGPGGGALGAGARFDDLRIGDTRAATVAWHPEGTGFWYTRYPQGDQYHRHVRWHDLSAGASADADPVVFDRLLNAEAWPDVRVSPDGEHLLVEMSVGWSRTDVHLLHVPSGEWTTVIEGVDAVSSFRFGAGGLLGRTMVDARNGRVVLARLDRPQVEHWVTVVPERDDAVVESAAAVADELVVVVARRGVEELERWTPAGERIGAVDAAVVDGARHDLGADATGGISVDDEGGVAFVVVSSFTAPTAVWRWAPPSDALVRWCPARPAADQVPALVVDQVTYPSRDGTEIGLFVVHRSDVLPGPDVPLVLNGYGGFAYSESPQWVPNLAAWCAEGGVWAVAGLRGGYEHGEAWHHAGRRQHKQNVFDDFHAAGDWLVARRWAAPERTALVGGSNGGLLVGAALTQRPDLARAVWCAVPLLDMVRFPRFLIARLWTDEYGDPDVAEEFGWLHAYSPYHHVEEGRTYPAVLFTTAEGDTRVDPLHARKMAALLQHAAADQDERPVLLLQAGRAGHGVGKPAAMRVAEGADALSFLAWQLGGPGA